MLGSSVYPLSLLALALGGILIALAAALSIVNAILRRRVGRRTLAVGLAGVASLGAGLVLLSMTPRLEFLLDEKELRAVSVRAQPLVEAITRFESDRGAAPETLEELVPGYLAAVPGTGSNRYPTFEYSKHRGEWRLWVYTYKLGALDTFVYAPAPRDFEEPEYRNRIGDWIYIHE